MGSLFILYDLLIVYSLIERRLGSLQFLGI